jgi:hypothetical protein
MDITKFNKELANKVAMAKVAERNHDVNGAIKIWLDISDMALKFSRSKSIDVSFRNMLLNRIESIIQHVKNLKSGKRETERVVENLTYIEEEPEEIEEIPEKSILTESIQNTKEKSTIPEKVINLEENEKLNQEDIKDSQYNNLPKGFKEIKTSEDFKIITPHDEDYLKKLLEKEKSVNMEIFKQKQENSINDKEKERTIDFQQPKNGKFLICFACGYDKNPPNAKKCKNCGIDLN